MKLNHEKFRPPAILFPLTPSATSRSPPRPSTLSPPPSLPTMLPVPRPSSPTISIISSSAAPSSPCSICTSASNQLEPSTPAHPNPLLAPSSSTCSSLNSHRRWSARRRSPQNPLVLQPYGSSCSSSSTSSLSRQLEETHVFDEDFSVDSVRDCLEIRLEDGLPVTVSPRGVYIPPVRKASACTTTSSSGFGTSPRSSSTLVSLSSFLGSTPGGGGLSDPPTPTPAQPNTQPNTNHHIHHHHLQHPPAPHQPTQTLTHRQQMVAAFVDATKQNNDSTNNNALEVLGSPDAAGGNQQKIEWDDLKLGHIIGQGSQAVVRKVKHVPTGTIYAMKCIDLSVGSCTSLSVSTVTSGEGAGGWEGAQHHAVKKTLQRELSRLTATSHPNIVSYCEAYFFDNSLKLLMEYVSLGPLSSLLRQVGPLPMGILAPMMKQVVSGLQSLHDSGILHRDLKPSNLLVTKKGVVKISDFGVSSALGRRLNVLARTQIGSTAYMSPERIRGEPYGPSGDVWGLGVTCAECALGVFPFRPEEENWESEEGPFAQPLNMFDLSMLIGDGKAEVQWSKMTSLVAQYLCLPTEEKPVSPPIVSGECKDFVAQCTQQNPAARASLAELALCSFIRDTPPMEFAPWFQSHVEGKKI